MIDSKKNRIGEFANPVFCIICLTFLPVECL